MSEPTEAQIKEFWEWCGVTSGCGLDGRLVIPIIDLNNLFKYAVPKARGLSYAIVLYAPESEKGFIGRAYPILAKGQNIQTETYDDPALALFWALWQVKGKSNE